MSRHDRRLEIAALLGAGVVTLAWLGVLSWAAGWAVGAW